MCAWLAAHRHRLGLSRLLPAASCCIDPPPRGVWIISGFGFRCMFCPLSVVLWALFILRSLCWFNSMYATCCSSYIIPL